MQHDHILGDYPEQGRRAGRRTAWRDSSGNAYNYFADSSGSAFLESRKNLRDTCTVSGDTAYAPFGYAYVRNNPMMLTDPLGLSWNCHYSEATNTTMCTAGGSDGGSGGGTGTCSMVAGHGGFGYGTIPGSGIDSEATCPPGDGKRGCNPPTHSGPHPKQPQNPQCIAAQRYAARVGQALHQTSEDFGLVAGLGGFTTTIFGVGEGPTFGLDTAGTVTAGAVTAFAGDAAYITGTAAAAFNSFANGNLKALSSFDLTRLVGLGATLAASRLPFIGRFAEQVGYAAEQATAAAQEAQAACQ